MPDYTPFSTALALPDQPEAAFAALYRLADELLHVTLFTVLTIDEQAGVVRRAWSNVPDAYPVLGTKPLPEDNGFRETMTSGAPMITNDKAGIEKTFFDHELILGLGCESCLNLPIRIAGEAVGSVNMLHVAHHWTPERVAQAEALRLPGAAAFMVARLFG